TSCVGAYLKSLEKNTLSDSPNTAREFRTPSFRSAANEHATSGSSLTGDSIHVVTSVSRHRKRTREDVRLTLAPSETLPLKRTRGSTGAGGGR
nr:hypothetical protein [Tanacetum cinerariifolium]